MSISFSSPVLEFGGYFTYEEPLTIEAFGNTNSGVASANSLYSENFVSSGNPPGRRIVRAGRCYLHDGNDEHA
jgi:hypothetical protein